MVGEEERRHGADASAGPAKQTRTVDLDIDIGAEAVDYKYVPLLSASFTLRSPPPPSNLPSALHLHHCLRWLWFNMSPRCHIGFSVRKHTDAPVRSPTKNPFPSSKSRCASWKLW